jgi:Ser/Thr protein kinase RdoA (MazF antagonist)
MGGKVLSRVLQTTFRLWNVVDGVPMTGPQAREAECRLDPLIAGRMHVTAASRSQSQPGGVRRGEALSRR